MERILESKQNVCKARAQQITWLCTHVVKKVTNTCGQEYTWPGMHVAKTTRGYMWTWL